MGSHIAIFYLLFDCHLDGRGPPSRPHSSAGLKFRPFCLSVSLSVYLPVYLSLLFASLRLSPLSNTPFFSLYPSIFSLQLLLSSSLHAGTSIPSFPAIPSLDPFADPSCWVGHSSTGSFPRVIPSHPIPSHPPKPQSIYSRGGPPVHYCFTRLSIRPLAAIFVPPHPVEPRPVGRAELPFPPFHTT